MSDLTIVFLILGTTVALFAWNRLPVEVVAVASSLALAATGVLDVDEALAGFGDPTVIFIATLFVVSEALDTTGVTTWAGQQLIRLAGDDWRRLVVLTLVLVALLTAVISPNGAVAALVPMVVVLAVRLERPTSQLLMPLAFAAHAGSMLALTGTPVNILVSDALEEATGSRFGFFEFGAVGLPLLVAVVVITLVLGPRLLPNRTPSSLPPDLSDLVQVLGAEYLGGRQVSRLELRRDQPLEVAELAAHEGVELIGVLRDGAGGLVHPEHLVTGDVVIVRGDAESVQAMAAATGLVASDQPYVAQGGLVGRRVGVVEVVIPPRSTVVGETVFPGMVTDSGDLVVLAVQRRGDVLGPRPFALAAGDTLLVQGEWGALEREIESDPAVRALDHPDALRRQVVPLGLRSTEALVITSVMVVLLATGWVPAAVAGLLAAGAILALGVLTPRQAYAGVSWSTVLLVGGMIPMTTAMEVSGAADRAADLLVDLAGGHGPRLLLLGIFLLAGVGGAAISNTATALIVIPIALSAGAELGIAPEPVLMAVTVSASAAFLLPITTPANLMVMGPGGYGFNDYWRFGLPIMVATGLLVVFWIPVVWSL